MRKSIWCHQKLFESITIISKDIENFFAIFSEIQGKFTGKHYLFEFTTKKRFIRIDQFAHRYRSRDN